MQLEGKRIAVTGGGNGCGAAAVRAFVREGANVASFDIVDSDGEAVVAQANSNGPGKATYFHIDISDRASVKEAFAAGASALGGYDIMVHPAAVSLPRPAGGVHRRGLGPADQHQPDRHLPGEPGDLPLPGRRTVVAASSTSHPGAGIRAYPAGAAYAATKGGVIAWTRSIAYAWGKHNITANMINPGIAGGLMTKKALEKQGYNSEEEFVEGMRSFGMNFDAMFPLGQRRFPPSDYDKNLPKYYGGDADYDLGPVVVFLASDGARFLTAQIFGVDGGMDPVR